MKRAHVFTISLLVGLVVWACQKRPDESLTATSRISVYASIDEAMDVAGAGFTVLENGESATVLEHIDVKHYMIYRVRLSDGRIGIVSDGNIVIRRDDVSSK